MFVNMITSLATPAQVYDAGATYDIPDAIGATWIRSGLAKMTSTPPDYVTRFMSRLDHAGPTVFLPPTMEFGHLITYFTRFVHWHKSSYKVVCCRPADRVLFPTAAQFDHDWTDPIPDSLKCGTGSLTATDWPDIVKRYPDHHIVPSGGLTYHEEFACPIAPGQRIPFNPKRRGLQADVLLAPRHRQFMPHRNWTHWQDLADAVTSAGISFATVGARATSLDLQDQLVHTGDLDTDAAIELMQQPNTIFVGQDSGASHLAAAVGCKQIVFREYLPTDRDWTPRMELFNPGKVTVVRDGWHNPESVMATLKRFSENCGYTWGG